VLVEGFPAGAWSTNCWVVAPAAGEECVIVDPGHDAVAALDETLARHRLKPVAVLLTHGHIDHVWSVVPVCGARDVAAWIHPADRHLLTDPGAGIGVPGTPVLGRLDWAEPADLRLLDDGAVLDLAGLQLRVALAPGHTPGSVTFSCGDQFFSGDLLFRDSIGRMDLPGGSEPDMAESLRRVVLPLTDETVVRPGHMTTTTIGRERQHNPYLALAARGATSFSAGARGL
jgi:hydroxyacylglutathione hydrolase